MEVQLEVPRRQLREIQKEIHRLSPIISSSAKVSIFAFANRYAREVKKEYRIGEKGGIPLASGTKEKRQQGKRGSVRKRAYPKYNGSNPLYRSGTLANSIEVLTKASGQTVFTKVRINPRKILPGGGVAWKVAHVHEEGRTFTVELPGWSRAYLVMLAQGKAGTDAGAPKNMRPITVTVSIPPRPVWQPVTERMYGRVWLEVMIPISTAVSKRTKFRVDFGVR